MLVLFSLFNLEGKLFFIFFSKVENSGMLKELLNEKKCHSYFSQNDLK